MNDKDTSPPVHQPDDNLFKTVMQEVENARANLIHFYPEVAEKIDLDSLSLASESFLTPQFELFKADIIYHCQWKNSKEDLYISLLWEHKLRPETYVSIQMGLYIFLAMYKMAKEKGRKLEPVLPLLFYNNKRQWKPKTIHELFKGKSYFDFFKPYIPNFQFFFNNISNIPTEQILAIETAFFRSAMLAMANRHDVNLIVKHIGLIFDLKDKDQMNVLATYVFGIVDRSPEEIEQLLESLELENLDTQTTKNNIMSTLDMLIKKGKDIGLKEGKELGIKEGEELGIKKGEELGIKKGEKLGIKKGKELGIKEGEELGIKKGEKREKAIQSLVTLLKIFHKFPNWTIREITQFSEVKKDLVIDLQKALHSKKKREIKKVIDAKFLATIQLTKNEKTKVDKLVSLILINSPKI